MHLYQISKYVICVNFEAQHYDGVDALVAGWGLTSEGGMTSDVLMEAKITVYPDNKCLADRTLGDFFEPASMLCAYAPNKDGLVNSHA